MKHSIQPSLSYGSLLIVTVLSFFLISCEEGDVPEKTFNLSDEQLAKDDNFKQLISLQSIMASTLYPKIDAAPDKEKFMSKLMELSNKQDLRSQRLMAQMMGFSDLQQFESHQQQKYNAINNLLERYPQLGDEQHQSTIDSAMKFINESDLV